MGFLSEGRLKEALCLQVDDELAGREHRLIGTIMLENNWMTNEHIETLREKMASNQIKSNQIKSNQRS